MFSPKTPLTFRQRWYASLALLRNPHIIRKARRSLIIAVVVGGMIIALNQGDILLAGAVTPVVLGKVLLTPCVPLGVSLYGAYIVYRNALASQPGQ